MGVKKGVKIVIGLVPLLIIAGFIESFITRYTFMPTLFKLLIIGGSVALIVYYFLIYPYRLFRNGKLHSN
jgi:hypothetical protein